MSEVEAVEAAPVHVRLIEINGLFRQYDHRIVLRQEDRVTILHGRNGVGKTAVLTLVAALLRGNYKDLEKYPFRTMRIEFSDGSYIEVLPTAKGENDKRRNRNNADPEPRVEIRYVIGGDEAKRFFPVTNTSQIVRAMAEAAPWLDFVSDDQWVDTRDGEYLTTDDVAIRYIDAAPPLPIKRTPEQKALRAFCRRIPLHFIETQRLVNVGSQRIYYDGAPPYTSTVKNVARELAEKIKTTDSTYRATSTRLDDSLPARLFAPIPRTPSIHETELTRRTEALEHERARLRNMGIIADTKTPFDLSGLDATRRAMFAVYLADNEEKLAVFKDLADRVEILRKIINGKFAPKRVDIDKDDGYKAYSYDGQPLDLNDLSSGEQHELVLLHNLLFRVERGALVLIDEPELSLHVAWQSEFLEDLIRIAKMVGFDALIATHSPYIVGSRHDLMERLGEPT